MENDCEPAGPAVIPVESIEVVEDVDADVVGMEVEREQILTDGTYFWLSVGSNRNADLLERSVVLLPATEFTTF